MSYALGSEAESMHFTEHGIRYRPAGPIHAVEIRSTRHDDPLIFAYAICGRAVRAWPDQPFDPAASGAHAECAARARRG